jgi:uncharacterized protein (TIGR02757 family)
MPDKRAKLRKALERLYQTYDFAGRVPHDPIQVPLRFRRKRDRECAGFIAASLAYGRVSLFLPVIEEVLSPMGSSPHAFLSEFEAKSEARSFSRITYRFQKPGDMAAFVHILSVLIRRHGSLEAAFLKHYREDDPDVGPALSGFMAEALGTDTTPVYGKNIRPYGLKFLFPSPERGGTCKRPALFLRWMVRGSDIDFGLWRRIPVEKLVIPLDTHIARVARCLGLTNRKSDGWKTAVEITDSLKNLDPRDPLKYDFALCHRGIEGVCVKHACGECEFGALRLYK